MKRNLTLMVCGAVVAMFLLGGCSSGQAADSPAESGQNDAATVGALLTDAAPEDQDDSVASGKDGDVVEIKEKLFIAQTDDIYLNPEDYYGKTIKYEGVFNSYQLGSAEDTVYYVGRGAPGCCGFDGTAGFEVIWEGEYPDKNDWVEAVGMLETYSVDGTDWLRIRLSSLTVLDERGAEFVAQ